MRTPRVDAPPERERPRMEPRRRRGTTRCEPGARTRSSTHPRSSRAAESLRSHRPQQSRETHAPPPSRSAHTPRSSRTTGSDCATRTPSSDPRRPTFRRTRCRGHGRRSCSARGRTRARAVVLSSTWSCLRASLRYDLEQEGTTTRFHVRPRTARYDRARPGIHGGSRPATEGRE